MVLVFAVPFWSQIMNVGPVDVSSVIAEFPERRFAVLLFIIEGAAIRFKNWVGLTTWPSRHLKISAHKVFIVTVKGKTSLTRVCSPLLLILFLASVSRVWGLAV
jgi:hypothetical protein